jgi:hypothetical protein
MSYPVALTFSFQVAQLQAAGGMDRLLARASRRVDGFARKRIVIPPVASIATGGIAAGSTSLPMTSTLGFDRGQEEAVIIGSGGTAEIIAIAPGGVTVTSWYSPYPGSLILAQPVAYSHAAGEAVQGCYQEISKVGNPSGRDIEEGAWSDLDQGAQIAAMHASVALPTTRSIFLKCYPIIKLYRLEHSLPISSEYTDLGLTGVSVDPVVGKLRLPLGSFVLAGGLFRSTYTAGFANAPDDIQEATVWYAADELQMMTSKGAYEIQSGKTKVKYASEQNATSIYVQNAEKLIRNGGYRRTA